MPADVRARVTKPRQFAHLSDEAYVAEYEARLAAQGRETRKALCRGRKSGQRYTFAGAERVRKQNWRNGPAKTSPRRRVIPLVKASDLDQRTAALTQRATFLGAHRDALTIPRCGYRSSVTTRCSVHLAADPPTREAHRSE